LPPTTSPRRAIRKRRGGFDFYTFRRPDIGGKMSLNAMYGRTTVRPIVDTCRDVAPRLISAKKHQYDSSKTYGRFIQNILTTRQLCTYVLDESSVCFLYCNRHIEWDVSGVGARV
jgi:hypothetical protein